MSKENMEVIPAPANVAVKTTPMTADIHPTTIDVSVSGETRESIATGQAHLIRWCERKIQVVGDELDELLAAVEHAKAKKWKISTLQRQANRASKRVEYYQKMLAAFQEGYVMVPNFPIHVFAIRTGKEYPKEVASFNRWDRFPQSSQKLPCGQGEYQNPEPVVYQDTVTVEEKGQAVAKTRYSSGEWDELDFPLLMAKPHIMQAVDHAMALKIFDEIGILPSPRSKGDPLIVGQLICGGSPIWSARRVTFMIAWHVDTRTL